jgi:hypothetical protein
LQNLRARYLDMEVGRFVQPDSIVPNPMNPQRFKRFSYVINNPLLYNDPSGRCYVKSDYGDYIVSGVCEDDHGDVVWTKGSRRPARRWNSQKQKTTGERTADWAIKI